MAFKIVHVLAVVDGEERLLSFEEAARLRKEAEEAVFWADPRMVKTIHQLLLEQRSPYAVDLRSAKSLSRKMEKLGISRVGDLVVLTKQEILNFPAVGHKAYVSLELALEYAGLAVKDSR